MITTILILLVWKHLHSRKLGRQLETFGCYTMGITQKAPNKLLDRFLIFYSYCYKGKVYTDIAFKTKNTFEKCGKYLVYLDSMHPKNNRIDLSHQVTTAELKKIISYPYPHQL